MVTVISPRLKKDYGVLCTDKVEYLCLRELEKFVEIPEAEYCWAEASDRQFKERDGCMVEVRLVKDCCLVEAYYKSDGDWDVFYHIITRYLKRLGVVVGGPSKKIWFRLLYEVE